LPGRNISELHIPLDIAASGSSMNNLLVHSKWLKGRNQLPGVCLATDIAKPDYPPSE